MDKKNLGLFLRELRVRRGFSQKEAASLLNVSSQAVSKWECGSGLPDVSQLISLADLYSVSIDELLGHDLGQRDEEIQTLLRRIDMELVPADRWEEIIDALRGALRKYPTEYRLMEKLCYALYIWPKQCGFDGTPKAERCANECIDYAEQIVSECTDNLLRHKALRWLVYQYTWFGNDYKLRQIADTMPSAGDALELSAEEILAHLSDLRQSREAVMRYLCCCADNLQFQLLMLVESDECQVYSSRELLLFCRMMNAMIKEMFQDRVAPAPWQSSRIGFLLGGAIQSMKVGEEEQARAFLDELAQVAEHWRRGDTSPFSCPLTPENDTLSPCDDDLLATAAEKVHSPLFAPLHLETTEAGQRLFRSLLGKDAEPFGEERA